MAARWRLRNRLVLVVARRVCFRQQSRRPPPRVWNVQISSRPGACTRS